MVTQESPQGDRRDAVDNGVGISIAEVTEVLLFQVEASKLYLIDD